MLPVRRANATSQNPSFREDKAARAGEGNLAWMTRACRPVRGIGSDGDVILLGGTSLAEFRVRVAQSQVRDDLTPSYWSIVGVREGQSLLTAPLWPLSSPDMVPISNGIRRLDLSGFDDPVEWPNACVIRFHEQPAVKPPLACLKDLALQRTVVDLPTLVLQWLAFVWGTGSGQNPLVNGFGLPSAVLVETAFGLAEIELTPGLASSSSCPEAIYQAAKWWHGFYALAAGTADGDHAASSWP